MGTFLLKNATKIVAVAALAVTIVYTLLLLFLPVTMLGVSGLFPVPASTGVDPYLSKAITLTFGFLATWWITKYMLGWNAFNKKIAAFAGFIAVWILYYFLMWGLTTAEPRKKMSELQGQLKAQQATIAQCTEGTVALRNKVFELRGARNKCVQLNKECQQQLVAEETAKTAALTAEKDCRAQAEVAQGEYAKAVQEESQKCQREMLFQPAGVFGGSGMQEAGQTLDRLPAAQPAVYTQTSPAVARTSDSPRKAHVVVLDAEYEPAEISDDEMVFTIAEKAGIDVVFSSYAISIWRREYLSESLERTKRNKPITFHRETDDWRVEGGTPSSKKEFNLAYYDNWLWLNDWVEMEFYGIDANGNSQKVVVAAGRR